MQQSTPFWPRICNELDWRPSTATLKRPKHTTETEIRKAQTMKTDDTQVESFQSLSRFHVSKSQQRTLSGGPDPRDQTNRNVHGLFNNPACTSNRPLQAISRLDRIKRQLLGTNDWAAIGAIRPVKISFTPTEELGRFGKRRKLTEADHNRLFSSGSRISRQGPCERTRERAPSELGSIGNVDIQIYQPRDSPESSSTDYNKSSQESSQPMLRTGRRLILCNRVHHQTEEYMVQVDGPFPTNYFYHLRALPGSRHLLRHRTSFFLSTLYHKPMTSSTPIDPAPIHIYRLDRRRSSTAVLPAFTIQFHNSSDVLLLMIKSLLNWKRSPRVKYGMIMRNYTIATPPVDIRKASVHLRKCAMSMDLDALHLVHGLLRVTNSLVGFRNQSFISNGSWVRTILKPTYHLRLLCWTKSTMNSLLPMPS